MNPKLLPEPADGGVAQGRHGALDLAQARHLPVDQAVDDHVAELGEAAALTGCEDVVYGLGDMFELAQGSPGATIHCGAPVCPGLGMTPL